MVASKQEIISAYEESTRRLEAIVFGLSEEEMAAEAAFVRSLRIQ